jgi:mono/diheme cytochrome c family protein
MTMKRWKVALLALLAIAILAAAYGVVLIRRGFSAKEQPSRLETAVARTVRNMAIPASAKYENNPFTATPENLTEAREHFADHCARCHANDGSGHTEIGQNLYPKAPDMRSPRTQNLTDGEIYYIINNGVRLTGMPAWGDSHQAEDSWKLVLFVRHLPELTSEEEKDMERFNPKSEVERAEQLEEEQFLSGGTAAGKSMKEQHHHEGEEQ